MEATINDLPLEILENICLHLWSTDLAQFSSVCHTWHQAVGTKPFRNVNFITERSLGRFINFLLENAFPYGSLVECIHFDMVQVFIVRNLVVNMQNLLYFCPNVQSISGNKVISTTVLQSLSSLPSDTELSRLQTIPITDWDIHYSLCAKKFNQSLMELDLRKLASDKKLMMGYGFPNLKRLTLGSTDQPFRLIDSTLAESDQLEYLHFELANTPFVIPPSAVDTYPSVQELALSSKLEHNFDYVGLNTFLFRFINAEKLTMSLFDTISRNQSLDQLYAFRDFIAWINTLDDGKLCIINVKPENLLTHLKYIYNTIPAHKEDWKTKIVFLRFSYYSSPIISYSTHTGYRERTFAITLDNDFAKNLVCSYLNRLKMPFTVRVQ